MQIAIEKDKQTIPGRSITEIMRQSCYEQPISAYNISRVGSATAMIDDSTHGSKVS